MEDSVSDFTTKRPNVMQQQLDPNLVSKVRGSVSRKTPERVCNVLFWGLVQSLRAKGWEVLKLAAFACVTEGSVWLF